MRRVIAMSAKVFLTMSAAVALFALGVGAFVLAVGLSEAYADEMVIEKRTEERVIEKAAPRVVEERVIEQKVERVEPPVVKERTTVIEKIPAAPAVVEKRTVETIETDD